MATECSRARSELIIERRASTQNGKVVPRSPVERTKATENEVSNAEPSRQFMLWRGPLVFRYRRARNRPGSASASHVQAAVHGVGQGLAFRTRLMQVLPWPGGDLRARWLKLYSEPSQFPRLGCSAPLCLAKVSRQNNGQRLSMTLREEFVSRHWHRIIDIRWSGQTLLLTVEWRVTMMPMERHSRMSSRTR